MKHYFSGQATITILLAFLLTAGVIEVAAQTSAGAIVGHITDASGAAVSNVQVIARSVLVGGTFRTISDREGNYRLTELPPAADFDITAWMKPEPSRTCRKWILPLDRRPASQPLIVTASPSCFAMSSM